MSEANIPSPTGEQRDAALAAAKALDLEDDAPVEVTPDASKPDDKAAATEAEAHDDLAALAAKGAERRRARQAEEAKTAEKSDAERRMAEKEAELDRRLQAYRDKDPATLLTDLYGDPMRGFDEIKKLAQSAEGGKQSKAIEAMLSRMERMESELQTYRDGESKRRQEAEQAETGAQIRRRFLTHTADKERYPLLGVLDDDDRLHHGIRVATLFEEAGEQYDDARVAKAVEADLAKRYRERWGHAPQAAKNSQVNGDRQRPINGQAAGESATSVAQDERTRMKNAHRLAALLDE